jgi:hypothetical protein
LVILNLLIAGRHINHFIALTKQAIDYSMSSNLNGKLEYINTIRKKLKLYGKIDPILSIHVACY